MNNSNICQDDRSFDDLYPSYIQELSDMHWTPVSVAKQAGDFLAVSNTNVLDIGSGVGKFCLTAGRHFPATQFYGVEQRIELFTMAEAAKKKINIKNVEFILGNLVTLNFKAYDHFYFFNSFYENIEPSRRIDKTIDASVILYDYYTRFLFKMLDEKPSETRLVTYYGTNKQVPPSYQIVDNSLSSLLKMWIKL